MQDLLDGPDDDGTNKPKIHLVRCISQICLSGGDSFGISSRRVEARISGERRESVGVLAWGAGKRMFERD